MHTPRQVAVAVPVFLPEAQASNKVDIPPELLAANEPLFLVCSSRKHPERYVLPKGGIEQGEVASVSALREGWEEGETAGFRGRHLLSLGPPIHDAKSVKKHKPDIPKASYHFEFVLVLETLEDWPESWREENVTGLQRVPTTRKELLELVQK